VNTFRDQNHPAGNQKKNKIITVVFSQSPSYNTSLMAEIYFHYRVFGLTVETPRPFPFLWPETDATRAPDIQIEFRSWPMPGKPPSLSQEMITLYGTDCAIFSFAPGKRIICLDGKRIIIDLSVPLSDAELQTWVFGRVIGWLLHQRGLTPLHAAVVRIGDVAVALAGHSGAGKSTLARALVRRGHGVISDDLAVIDPDTLLVSPGFPSLKLWESAAVANGDDVRHAPAVKPGANKFHISLPDTFETSPVPVGLVVAIGRDPARSDFSLQRLSPRQSEAMLYCHVFNNRMARLSNSAATGFHWSLSVAAKVPVIALDRRDQMADLPLICAEIERLVQYRMEPA
jgi:hypothetical protein